MSGRKINRRNNSATPSRRWTTWEDRFQELKEYHSTFHHCNIHVDPNPELQSELAKWVVEQRQQGKRLQKQMPSSLTLDQYKLLDSLGFVWKKPKSRRS